mmetsp:Transcript_37091/g.116698  ORF Transcript_37091/g.116698 Transcript_37091/m.116698 type:complete len:112 (+) Transcript_37091:860-1195(+)
MACFFFVIDDQVLSRFPILKRDALIKKYSKYSVPTNVEKHEKHVLPDHFEFSPDMLFRRSIAGHHMHRQEEAKAFGAPAPAHQRSGEFLRSCVTVHESWARRSFSQGQTCV